LGHCEITFQCQHLKGTNWTLYSAQKQQAVFKGWMPQLELKTSGIFSSYQTLPTEKIGKVTNRQ
jgi:hypothetical protein